jgi:NAD(P)-dependent dehydrogenase (short-subunit alcohol dehydrogenase family)
VGKVEDIAEMCEFLALNEKSGFITGQTFIVDGGVSVKKIKYK